MNRITLNDQLPKRLDWEGNQQSMTYDELKNSLKYVDHQYLLKLFSSIQTSQPSYLDINQQSNIESEQTSIQSLDTGLQAICHINKDMIMGGISKSLKKELEIQQFKRVKTIFGHAKLNLDEITPIYNIKFDRKGDLIFTGADDGLVKIWDRDTLTLQASLHGHQNYITDIDVSLCNQFLASSEKSGTILVWSIADGSLYEQFREHTQQVNNLKFYHTALGQKTKEKINDPYDFSNHIQLLICCSDDGTVKLFDFSKEYQDHLLQSQSQSQVVKYVLSQTEADSQQFQKKITRNKLNQSQKIDKNKIQSQSQERFHISLVPEDFRVGSRNKKIDSCNINDQGLVVAGTCYGEMFVWKIDFREFKKQNPKCSIHIGNFRKHTKSLHILEFSPNEQLFISASLDGVARIWDLQALENKNDKLNHSKERISEVLIQISQNMENDSIIKYSNKVDIQKSKVEQLCWSCNSKYLAISLCQEFENQQKKDQSKIKIWDSFQKRVIIDDLAERNGVNLNSQTNVLKFHPYLDHILVSGSEGGQICIWNLQKMSLISKFIEYGIYSIDKYTFNDPLDCRFSPDGNTIAVSSYEGTISLFVNDYTQYKYRGTRVEQFFQFDDENRELDIFNKLIIEPKVCSSNQMPYENQAPNRFIGKFSNIDQLNPIEYERQLRIRQALSREEEEFLQQQLEDARRMNLFNNEQQQNQMNEINPEEDQNDADAPMINVQNLHQVNNYQRRNSRIVVQERERNNIDPENSVYDRESDDNFEPDSAEEDFSPEKDQDESSYQGSYDSGMEDIQPKRENQYFLNERQENLVQQKHQEQRNQRNLRAMRRNGQIDSQDFEESGQRKQSQNQNQSRKRLVRNNGQRRVSYTEKESSDSFENSDCSDENNDDESDEMMSEIKIKTRRQLRNEQNQIQSRRQNTDQDQIQSRRSRRNEQIETQQAQKSSTYSQRRKRILNDDEESKNEEEKIEKNEDQLMFDEEEIDFQIPVLDKKKVKPKKIIDEDYQIDLVQMQQNYQNIQYQTYCHICQRLDPILIGPFVNKKQIESSQYYFHSDCLDINQYSFYDKNLNKWYNVGRAIQFANEMKKKGEKCSRCDGDGPSIQCIGCNKYYHGFYCSTLYLIKIDVDKFVCLECKNLENFQHLKQNQKYLMNDDQFLQAKKKLDRDFLLSTRVNEMDIYQSKFVPQVSDNVYYFFQGHEKFITAYNCQFYTGDNRALRFEYPWIKIPQLLQPTLCTIKNISFKFPTKNAFYLMKRFGKTVPEVEQVPSIIMTLNLQIVNPISNDHSSFYLDYFPHQLSNFLVLQEFYERQLFIFNKMKENKQVKGNIFRLYTQKDFDIRVHDIKPFEPSIYPNQQWNLIQYEPLKDNRSRNREGRRLALNNDQNGQVVPFERLEFANFWEINMNQHVKNPLTFNELIPKLLEYDEKERILNTIDDFIQNNIKKIEPFIFRVTQDIAPDYLFHIEAEMYLDLIKKRIKNDYYRSQFVNQFFFQLLQQIFCDLDLISYNCHKYNGSESQLTKTAKSVLEKLRMKIKSQFNSVSKDSHKASDKLSQDVIFNFDNHFEIGSTQQENGQRQGSQIEEEEKKEEEEFRESQTEKIRIPLIVKNSQTLQEDNQQTNMGRQRAQLIENEVVEKIQPKRLRNNQVSNQQITNENGKQSSDNQNIEQEKRSKKLSKNQSRDLIEISKQNFEETYESQPEKDQEKVQQILGKRQNRRWNEQNQKEDEEEEESYNPTKRPKRTRN